MSVLFTVVRLLVFIESYVDNYVIVSYTVINYDFTFSTLVYKLLTSYNI